MAQTPITATVAHDSDTVAVAEDLSALTLPALLVLTDYQTALPVQQFLAPAGGLGWRARLAAGYAGPGRNGVAARLHTQFTPGGQPLWDVGDTGTRQLLNEQSTAIESLIQGLLVATSLITAVLLVDPVAGNDFTGGRGNNRPYLNLAAAAAAALPGDTILLRAGFHDLYAALPPVTGVSILGPRTGPTKHAQANAAAYNQTPSGAVLRVHFGANGTATDPAVVTLRENAHLSGVVFFYPDQDKNAATPTPYPYSVRIESIEAPDVTVSTGGQSVSHVELLNSYRGIEVLTGTVHLFRITGTPLAMGIRCDGAPDTIWIQSCEFNPWANYNTPASAWVRANGVAFEIGRVDELIADSNLAFFYRFGVRTVNTAPSERTHGFNGGGYGTWTNCAFDTCTTCARIEGGLGLGWEFNACKFAPNSSAVGAGIGLDVAAGAAVSVRVIGGRFWGPLDCAIRLQGSGDLLVMGVKFACTSAGDFIRVSAANTLIIAKNFFDVQPGGQHIAITPTNCVGDISGNICAPGMKITNASAGVSASSAGAATIGAIRYDVGIGSAVALSAAGTYTNIAAVSAHPVPATAGYRVYATLRYYQSTSASADSYWVARLTANGSPIGGTERLMFEVTAAGVVSGTWFGQWDLGLSNGDVVGIQVKRDGAATWTAAEIRADANGYGTFGYMSL